MAPNLSLQGPKCDPKWNPNFGAKQLFGICLGCWFLHAICLTQGSILVLFGLHFEAPGLHFGMILGHRLAPEGSNLEPYTSDIYSFRFCSIHRNLPCWIPSLRFCLFYKNILHIASTPTPKTSKNISSIRLSQKLPDHTQGAAVSRSVLRYIPEDGH